MGLLSCLARWAIVVLIVEYAYGACIPSYNHQYETQILHKTNDHGKSCHCNIEQNNVNICSHNTNTGCSNNQQICGDGSSAHQVPQCPNQENNCYQPQCAQPICDGNTYSCGQCADDDDDNYYYYYYHDVDNQNHLCNCSQSNSTNTTKPPSTTVKPTARPTTPAATTARPTTTKKPATTVKQTTVSPTTKKPTTVQVVPITQDPALAPRMLDTWTFPVHPKSEDIIFFKN